MAGFPTAQTFQGPSVDWKERGVAGSTANVALATELLGRIIAFFPSPPRTSAKGEDKNVSVWFWPKGPTEGAQRSLCGVHFSCILTAKKSASVLFSASWPNGGGVLLAQLNLYLLHDKTEKVRSCVVLSQRTNRGVTLLALWNLYRLRNKWWTGRICGSWPLGPPVGAQHSL